MNHHGSLPRRTQRFLRKYVGNASKGWQYSDAGDSRQPSKVKHRIEHILWLLEFGMLSSQRTLRDVERLGKQLAPLWRAFVGNGASDTTMWTVIPQLDSDYLRSKLVKRIRSFHRSKMLQPVRLPWGVVTVDGKNLATLSHDADGRAHARTKANQKWQSKQAERQHGQTYYLTPALRATLTSSEAKVCIDQLALPAGQGESTHFLPFVQRLHDAYGRSQMFRVIDADAGLTSLANADGIERLGYLYIFGLKNNQSELFEEAKALLEPLAASSPAQAQTPWEPSHGKMIRRRLWRTDEMRGFENSVGTWTHLTQTWLVRQETLSADGTVQVEDRYFLTSVPWGALTAQQILLVVRNHWGVENDSFHSLDVQWHEDSAPWCTQGNAVWALGLIRLMAYNTDQLFRRRRLRPKKPDRSWASPMSWRALFETVWMALLIPAPQLVSLG